MVTKDYLLNTIIISTLILSGCGGSGNSSDKNTNITPSTPGDIVLSDSILQLEESLVTNQGVDLVLYLPNDELTNIKWQQTAGEPIDLYATSSKVIGFTPTISGEYSFDVSFSRNGSASQTISKSISVGEESSVLTTRLGHAVRSDNKVSLRVHPNADINTGLITWQQVAGPTVSLTQVDPTGELAIFFDAPQVNTDTYLSFEASIIIDEVKHIDKVTILVEPANTIRSNAYFDTRVATVFPYNVASPYKDELADCVYSNNLTSSCTLSRLPLIANEVNSASETPNIDTIMDRVVVSHQWMGDRFKEFLMSSDPHNDFKNLLRATTAIVISYDVRPSFYWAATGAIYLDADNFWLTAQERDTINEAPDYRAAFGNDLQFVMPWRYVKDNDYASVSTPTSVRIDRSPSVGFYRLASLMYHELAHANDFFPSTEWATHSSQTRALDAALSSNLESDQLSIALPLQSVTMRNLAQVSFAGENASTTEKSYLPTDIEGFFSPDVATDFYAYSSLREDYAMLFEELMMQQRYNVFRDVAITNQPTGDSVFARDYIVTWGQRGRIGENTIKPRVLFSASRVLPDYDSPTALANTPAPINMTSGDDWIENLAISPSISLKSAKGLLKKHTDQQPVMYRYHHKSLPKH